MSTNGERSAGEFISIGNGAIGAAATLEIETNSPYEQAFIQSTKGLIAIDHSGNPIRIEEVASVGDLDPRALTSVSFALEATPYRAHEEIAKDVKSLADLDIPTIMASKGFMAEHPEDAMRLYKNNLLGADASLGGNTGMLPLFRAVSDDRTKGFKGIVNGTMVRAVELMRLGKLEEEIVNIVLPKTDDNPKGEGLAEPDAETLLDVFRGEHTDNVGKAVNAYNFGYLPNLSGEIDGSQIARVSEASIDPFTQEQIDELAADPHRMAYVVNWHRDGSEIDPRDYDRETVPGVFTLEVGEQGLITGGLLRLSENDPLFPITQSHGPKNGIAIAKQITRDHSDRYVSIGTGAGPVPTAHRMFLNLKEILKKY